MHPKIATYIKIAICLSIVLLLAGGLCTGKPIQKHIPDLVIRNCNNVPGFEICDGKCVNVKIDENNCGRCGNACEDGYICHKGACVSGPPGIDCNDGNACTTDVWSRGKCLHTPKADGTKCENGACFEGACYEEYASCLESGGTVTKDICCESAQDFPDTCLIGACGCSPENSKETLVCQCGEGMCFDGATERCVPLEPVPDCPGGCPDDGDLCTINHRCENGECVYDTTVCIALEGYTCCPQVGGCVNTWWDEENCGECGNECPEGWGCCNGNCQPDCPIEDPGPIKIPFGE